MESYTQNEPPTPEFRKKVVSDFVKDVAEGRVSLGLDYKARRPEDIEMISDILAKLVGHLNDYVLGLKGGEEFDFLERQLFFCISVLRTYDAFKTNLSTSIVEDELRKLESKVEDSKTVLDQILSAVQNTSQIQKTPPRRVKKPKKVKSASVAA